MERELSGLCGGRKVDLRTVEDVCRYFRQQVLEEAEVIYNLPPLIAALEHATPGEVH